MGSTTRGCAIWLVRPFAYELNGKIMTALARDTTLPATSKRRRRRRHQRGALPNRSMIELQSETIRRIDCAFVGPLDPDMTRIVDPGSRRHSHLVQEVKVPAILRNVGKATWRAGTYRDALPCDTRRPTASVSHCMRCRNGKTVTVSCASSSVTVSLGPRQHGFVIWNAPAPCAAHSKADTRFQRNICCYGTE